MAYVVCFTLTVVVAPATHAGPVKQPHEGEPVTKLEEPRPQAPPTRQRDCPVERDVYISKRESRTIVLPVGTSWYGCNSCRSGFGTGGSIGFTFSGGSPNKFIIENQICNDGTAGLSAEERQR
jgi:hypothetical protein